MKKRSKKTSSSKAIGLSLLALFVFSTLIVVLLSNSDVALLNPKGFIALEQYRLIIFTVVLLLDVAIPTLVVLYSFAWEYRESNKKALYNPHIRYGKFFVLGLWAIPSIVVIILASVMWPATHRLEPRKKIASDNKPLTIQVVALRWKWLFIYPEQNIATVNFAQIPTDTSVQFELTADETPMSSFWIPHLGGQLYAMTGHVNRLNLLADTAGDYTGKSAEINGDGFSGMTFTARASSKADFDQWVQHVKQSPKVLDNESYEKLLKPSENNSTEFFAQANQDLYANMLMKYTGSHDHHAEQE